MSDRRGGALSFAATIVAGCSFQPLSVDDSTFRCSASRPCPPGFACEDTVCRQPDEPIPDARPGPTADAAGLPDAVVLADAAVLADAPTPGPPQVRRFGDHLLADHPGTMTDTYLSAADPDETHGAAASVVVDGAPTRIALIHVDVSVIPRGSRVDGAHLVLDLRDDLEAGALQVHAMLVPWDGPAASFEVTGTGVAWPTPGAGGASAASEVVAEAPAREDGELLLALPPLLVQGWVDDPGTNLGVRLTVTGSGTAGCSWSSTESVFAIRRPFLEVVHR